LADTGENVYFGFDRNVLGAVVELRESLQTQQISSLDVHFQVVGNAELAENFTKLPAFDRDFAPSSAQPLVTLGSIASDASPDVVVTLKEADRPGSFRDGKVQEHQASGFYVVNKLLAARVIKRGVCLDCHDLEPLCQIEFGVFSVVEAHIVDQIPLHGASFSSLSLLRQILCGS